MLLAISWQQSVSRAVSIVFSVSDPGILSGSECFSIQGIDRLNYNYRYLRLLRLSKMRHAHGRVMAVSLALLALLSMHSVESLALEFTAVSSAFLFESTNVRHPDYQHCYA